MQNFINISMSSIASKWFGEGEKYVKVVLSLASKIFLSVTFVDEVDSMLGRREIFRWSVFQKQNLVRDT